MPIPLLAAALGLGVGAAQYGMRRSREQQQMEQMQAIRQQGAANLMAGAGFAGPQVGLDASRVQGLQGALASEDPNIQAAAIQEMRDYQAGLGFDMTPQQQQTLAQGLQSMDIAAAQEERAAQLFPGQLEQQQMSMDIAASQEGRARLLFPGEVEAQSLGNELNRLQLEAAQNPAFSMPDIITVMHPGMDVPVNVPISGEQWFKQQTGADEYQSMLQDVKRMTSLIDEYGSEAWGVAAREMSELRNRIIFSSSRASGAGAPQAAELELLARGLPDPTSRLANIRGTLQAIPPGGQTVFRDLQEQSYMAGYLSFAQSVSQTLYQMQDRNPALNIDVKLLDSRVFKNRMDFENRRDNYGQENIIRGYYSQ